jgi:hypothetical protein
MGEIQWERYPLVTASIHPHKWLSIQRNFGLV